MGKSKVEHSPPNKTYFDIGHGQGFGTGTPGDGLERERSGEAVMVEENVPNNDGMTHEIPADIKSSEAMTSKDLCNYRLSRFREQNRQEDLPNCRSTVEPNQNLDSNQTLKKTDLGLTVSIQSLLAQFAHPQVRADLHNGKFGYNVNPNILGQIDDLRWTLMPRWQNGGLVSAQTRSDYAANHMIKLLEKSTDVLSSDPNSLEAGLTYEEWFDTLMTISKDRYWDRVSADDRCTHILTSDTHSRDHRPHQKPMVKKLTKSCEEGCRCPTVRNQQKPKRKSSRDSRSSMKIEEITISSTDTEPEDVSDSYSSSSTASSSGRSSGYRRNRRKTRVYKRSYVEKKEVVKPEIFNIKGNTTLRDFFKTFEHYFGKKYSGDSNDKTQLLGTFLKEELLEVFTAKGGRAIGYPHMKDILLEHCKNNIRVDSKSYKKKLFSEARQLTNETVGVYAIRLTGLAEKAYSSDTKECARQLRTKFLASLPDSISEKVKDIERTLEATSSNHRKHLPFKKIIKIAEDMQKETKEKMQTIMWSSSIAEKNPVRSQEFFKGRHVPVQNYQPKTNYKPDSMNRETGNSTQNQSRSPRRNGPWCNYCQSNNHWKQNCWKASGRCLLCGKQHQIEQCPRYDPNRGNRNMNRNIIPEQQSGN